MISSLLTGMLVGAVVAFFYVVIKSLIRRWMHGRDWEEQD